MSQEEEKVADQADGEDKEEKPKVEVPEEVDDLRMQRTEEPEYIIKFDKIRDKIVFDGQGNKIKFGDIYKRQKTIIFFVRHFLDFITKDYVEDLASIPLEYLQEADVRLVVIGPAPHKFINDFRKETGLHYTLYCDPEREIYEELQLPCELKPADVNKSKHIKQNAVMGVLRSTWKAMRIQEWQGDAKQQGGSFIFGPGDVVHYSHVDSNQVDHALINDVLTAAGVQTCSFPKDPRVQDV